MTTGIIGHWQSRKAVEAVGERKPVWQSQSLHQPCRSTSRNEMPGNQKWRRGLQGVGDLGPSSGSATDDLRMPWPGQAANLGLVPSSVKSEVWTKWSLFQVTRT